MTEAVSTQGFAMPTGSPHPAVMPQDAKPGFVVQPIAPATLDAVAPAAAAAPSDALAAAITALTESMKPTAAEPTVATPAANLNTLDPSTLEDPTLRSMAGAFKLLGSTLDFDRVFSKALDSGDATLLDTAYLKEKGGANAQGLIDLAQGIVAVVQQKATEQTNAVYALAGGEAQWNAATAAFNKNAPVELRLAVSQMADSGKPQHIAAAAKLVMQFATGQGFVPTPANLISAANTNAQGQALDKLGFQTELRKLDPNARDFQAKRGDLFARRALGKRLGN